MKSERWKLLRHVYGQHRFYFDSKVDRVAVADESVEPGGTPDQQDDGLIYLVTDLPILVTVYDDQDDDGEYQSPTVTIPVEQPDGDGGFERCGHIMGDPDEWLWIAAEFSMEVKQEFSSGRAPWVYKAFQSKRGADG